jgi:zinc protease
MVDGAPRATHRSGLVLALLGAAVSIGCGIPSSATKGSREHRMHLQVKSYSLRNGMTLTVSEDHSLPFVAVSVIVEAGVVSESPKSSGFAHLFEHLLSTGPTVHIDSEHHATIVDAIGGYQEARTDYDYTVYYAMSLSSHLEALLWLESDRMGFFAEALTQETLDNQRRVVINERKQRVENVPAARAQEKLFRTLFPPPHPYGGMPFGSTESLGNATIADVKDFYLQHYQPANIKLCITGDVTPDEALRAAKKYFETLPDRGRPSKVSAQDGAAPTTVGKGKATELAPRGTLGRAEIQIALAGPPIFGQYHSEMDLWAIVLGDGEGSWLHSRLVQQRRTASSVSCAYRPRQLASVFFCDVKAADGVDIATLESELRTSFQAVLQDGPTPAMVDRAYRVWEASFYRGIESLMDRANALNRYAMYGDPARGLDNDVIAHASVTRSSMMAAARAWLNPERWAIVELVEGVDHE